MVLRPIPTKREGDGSLFESKIIVKSPKPKIKANPKMSTTKNAGARSSIKAALVIFYVAGYQDISFVQLKALRKGRKHV